MLPTPLHMYVKKISFVIAFIKCLKNDFKMNTLILGCANRSITITYIRVCMLFDVIMGVYQLECRDTHSMRTLLSISIKVECFLRD